MMVASLTNGHLVYVMMMASLTDGVCYDYDQFDECCML